MPGSVFDIPAQFRDMVDNSVNQAKSAFEQYLDATHKAASQIDGSTKSARDTAAEVNRQALAFVESNVSAYFDLVNRLMQAKSPDEVATLQKDFYSQQMAKLAEHGRDVGSAMEKAGSEALDRLKR